jgi:hypothetical protein
LYTPYEWQNAISMLRLLPLVGLDIQDKTGPSAMLLLCDFFRIKGCAPVGWLLIRDFGLYQRYFVTPSDKVAPVNGKNKENMVPKIIAPLERKHMDFLLPSAIRALISRQGIEKAAALLAMRMADSDEFVLDDKEAFVAHYLAEVNTNEVLSKYVPALRSSTSLTNTGCEHNSGH